MFRVCFLIGAGIKNVAHKTERTPLSLCESPLVKPRSLRACWQLYFHAQGARTTTATGTTHTITTTTTKTTTTRAATAQRRAEAATTATSQQQFDTHLPTWAAWCESVLLLPPSPFLSRVPSGCTVLAFAKAFSIDSL